MEDSPTSSMLRERSQQDSDFILGLEGLENEAASAYVIEIFGEGAETFLKTTKLATGFQNGLAMFQKPNTNSFPYVKQASLDIFWSTCKRLTTSGNEGQGQSDGRTSAATEESTPPERPQITRLSPTCSRMAAMA